MSRITELTRLACALIDQGKPRDQAIASVLRQVATEQTVDPILSDLHPSAARVLSAARDWGRIRPREASVVVSCCEKQAHKIILNLRRRGLLTKVAFGVYAPTRLSGVTRRGKGSVAINKEDRATACIGRRITSTHPRAKYWREYKRRVKLGIAGGYRSRELLGDVGTQP
jgi:hypothetical protein